MHARPSTYSPAYVDTNLVGTGKIAKAAILGQQGGVWATSAGFNVRLFPLLIVVHRVDIVPQLGADEQSAILAALSNSEGALASGLRLEKQKYFVFRADGRSIYGKKAVSRTPVRVILSSKSPSIRPMELSSSRPSKPSLSPSTNPQRRPENRLLSSRASRIT